MDHAAAPDSVTTRLREGFERIALVLRADLWASAGDEGLNPTQAQVLGLLAGRSEGVRADGLPVGGLPAGGLPTEGLRAKEIASHLAVSPPSIADTLAALERKGLVTRTPDPADARATRVQVTEAGAAKGRAVSEAASHVRTALALLSVDEQADLLRTQVKIIRLLQQAGAIPEQRMCVTCRHFRPNAHPGGLQPHHCAFIDAPIGTRDLRLDCGEHAALATAAQAAAWAAFEAIGPPADRPPA